LLESGDKDFFSKKSFGKRFGVTFFFVGIVPSEEAFFMI
jgi:hypothetical protein